MTEENVEVVLEGIRRFEAADFDGLAQRWRSDSRITGPEGWPEPGPFVGRDAVIGQFRRLAADWAKQRLGCGGRRGPGRLGAAAYRLGDGLITEAHFRWTRDEALEAAGLSE